MRRFVVMGVSGCGKTSIGAAFAAAIGGRFIEAKAATESVLARFFDGRIHHHVTEAHDHALQSA